MLTEDKDKKGIELATPSVDVLAAFAKMAQTLVREQNSWLSEKSARATSTCHRMLVPMHAIISGQRSQCSHAENRLADSAPCP